MEDSDDWVKCAHHNCDKSFKRDSLVSHGDWKSSRNILFHSILKSRMFCMKCCDMHAQFIMRASRIPDEESEDDAHSATESDSEDYSDEEA